MKPTEEIELKLEILHNLLTPSHEAFITINEQISALNKVIHSTEFVKVLKSYQEISEIIAKGFLNPVYINAITKFRDELLIFEYNYKAKK